MSKHTIGPWEVTKYPEQLLVTSSPRGAYVAVCDGISATIDNAEELLANANLIAAAPDMLAALKEIEEHHVSKNDKVGRPLGRSKTLRIARAAIAKAEGK